MQNKLAAFPIGYTKEGADISEEQIACQNQFAKSMI